jgi:hypothetical protein
MPQDTNKHAVPAVRSSLRATGWFAATQLHRPIHHWIKQASKAAPDHDWTTSKSSRSARRPVWE